MRLTRVLLPAFVLVSTATILIFGDPVTVLEQVLCYLGVLGTLVIYYIDCRLDDARLQRAVEQARQDEYAAWAELEQRAQASLTRREAIAAAAAAEQNQ